MGSVVSDDPMTASQLAQRMKPRDLKYNNPQNNKNNNNTTAKIPSKQFFQLHHMKTGGTSLGNMIRCALNRASSSSSESTSPSTTTRIPFYNLEECSPHHYQQCITGQSSSCVDRIDSSAVMEFCAPLFQVQKFQWLSADAVTVIRHPVDRVWSMYRFRTKNCFSCLNLTDIYTNYVDTSSSSSGGGEEVPPILPGVRKEDQSLCLAQLVNHQTRNLLSSKFDDATHDTQQQQQQQQRMIEEAIENLRTQFTVVGITEELDATAQMMGQVFPWLATELSHDTKNNDTAQLHNSPKKKKKNAAAAAAIDPRQCPLGHANASPQNNRCGPSNTHWDLPSHPDEETRRLILQHNQLDLMLYEAAKQRFQLQKEALRM